MQGREAILVLPFYLPTTACRAERRWTWCPLCVLFHLCLEASIYNQLFSNA
jgi:hypothetical protein